MNVLGMIWAPLLLQEEINLVLLLIASNFCRYLTLEIQTLPPQFSHSMYYFDIYKSVVSIMKSM